MANRIKDSGGSDSVEARDVTVLFSDIRDFTAMSETMDAQAVWTLRRRNREQAYDRL